MRVVMVNHAFLPLPPKPADSPALVLDQLARALVRRGVSVVAVGGAASPVAVTDYERVELEGSLRTGGVFTREVEFGIRARGAVRRVRPDLVHYHASTPAALMPGRRAFPAVLTYAAPVTAEGRAPTMGPISFAGEAIERVACRRADRVVALSERTGEFLRDRFALPAHKLITIPNGVDTERFHPGEGAGARMVPRDAPVILCVARVAPYKDQVTLVRALAQPELARRPVRVRLVGPLDDQRYVDEVRRIARSLGVEERVELAGRADFASLPDIYRGAALVAAPSRGEGFPLALLEAMSSGIAVVASDIPQHREVGPRAGVRFFAVGDAGALARELSMLLDDNAAREREGHAARTAAVDSYSWDAVAARYEALYAGLAG